MEGGPKKPSATIHNLAEFRRQKSGELSKEKNGYWQDMSLLFKTAFALPEIQARFPSLNALMLDVRMNDCLIAAQNDDSVASDARYEDLDQLHDHELDAKISNTLVTSQNANEILMHIETLYMRLGAQFPGMM